MKAAVRARLLSLRASLSSEERRRQSRAVVSRLQALPVLQAAQVILGYHPLPEEVDVLPFLEAHVGRGRRAALPRISGNSLGLHEWRPGDEVQRNAFSILEPTAQSVPVEPVLVDAVVVPCVGVDLNGHRLGFGRGYYDRLLASMPRALRVCVAFDEQLVAALPQGRLDVRMDWVVSAQRTMRFERG